MNFVDLRLSEPILRAVAAAGYTVATPVQEQAIPHVLEGRDLLGSAQTGTGKTAAFALPILHRLFSPTLPAPSPSSSPTTPTTAVPTPRSPRLRCLILCPTRELATQIAGDFRTYGRNFQFRSHVIFGGVSQHHQVQALRQGLDILVATPGRLLDLMGQGHVDLRGVETLVLDEADRMLDMGFIADIRKIVARIPTQRQTLLFSATMPNEIRRLAESLLKNPVNIQIAHASATADNIKESVYFVEKFNKPALLASLIETLPMARAIVFTRTKHGADRVVRQLHEFGIRSEAIHGNKSQNARQRSLDNFRSNKTHILVATDLASRGIDIDDISHVVNFDLTHEPETYVHRIGRTARAGASGAAVSFCDRDERPNLKQIERLIRRSIPVRADHPPLAVAKASNGQHSHASERPHNDRPRRDEKPHAARPHATGFRASKPHFNKSQAAEGHSDKRHFSKPHSAAPHSENARFAKPHAARPHAGKPRFENSRFERSNSEQTRFEKPRSDKTQFASRTNFPTKAPAAKHIAGPAKAHHAAHPAAKKPVPTGTHAPARPHTAVKAAAQHPIARHMRGAENHPRNRKRLARA